MGQIQLTISLVMIALFTVAVITFATNFAIDNNAPINIASDTDLSSLGSVASGNLSQFASASQNQYASIVNSTIEPGSQTIQSSAPFAITPLASISTSTNIIKVGYTKIFGGDSGFGIFIAALISLLLFMIGLYIYKTLRGFPD